MHMKNSLLALIALLLLVIIGVLIWDVNQQAEEQQVEEPQEEPEEEDAPENVVVTQPRRDAQVGAHGLVIVGEARVFENTVQWRVKDSAGAVLDEGFTTAASPDIGQFGPFVAYANYTAVAGEEGAVEVFVYSAKDGSEEEMVRVPVRFVAEEEAQIFLSVDATPLDCGDVAPVNRFVLDKAGAVWEVLESATEVPRGVILKSLTENDGIVTVDFNSAIEAGGSCRVTAIRAQITSTLKAFDGVNEVIITVEGGDPDLALQP